MSEHEKEFDSIEDSEFDFNPKGTKGAGHDSDDDSDDDELDFSDVGDDDIFGDDFYRGGY